MALAPEVLAMTPSPAPSPIAPAPARNGAGAAGASEAASAFALLLAGVLPIPLLAAAPVTAALGNHAARPDADPAPAVAAAGLPGAPSQPGAPAGSPALPAAGQGSALQVPAGAEHTTAPTGVDPMPERPFRPTPPSIIGPDRPPASPLDQGQVAAVQQTSTDRAGLANMSWGAAEPAIQAASAGFVEWAADAEVVDRALAEARLTSTGAIDPRAALATPPRAAAGNLARAVGENPSDRPGSASPESLPRATTDTAEPDRRSTASAPEPAPAADGPAPKLRPAAAPTPPSVAAGDARIDPSVEIGDAAPGRTERVAGETPVPAGRPLPPAPVVQLGIHIAAAASRRIERLVVQLEPAALGRVEVRLDFTHDNRVSAVIAAERPETLEVLQRDSRALERGLQDAGLRLDQNALSFSLRQEQRGQERGAGTPGTWPAFEARPGSGSGADRPDDARPAYWIGAHRVLDIRI
jgi:hypothetical protein